MKTLVTHINPHLDDICAIWLFKKYISEFKDAVLEFIPASLIRAKNEESKDKIFLGTGGGRFDEHKGDLNECATSLVWKFIKENNFTKGDDLENKGVEEIVEWVKVIDLGKFPDEPYGDFTVQAFIRPLDNKAESSREAAQLGGQILEKILKVLKQKQQSIKDWQQRVEFQSRFGKSVAVKSETINRTFCKSMGGDLFLIVDPRDWKVQFFTPNEDTDLEPIYTLLKRKDPQADWFLHQSHHMVICGAGAKPVFQKTNLTFEQLIQAAESVF